MSFARFTERARMVVDHATNEARGFKHNYIGTEHLLLGLLHQEDSLAGRVLSELGLTLDDLRQRVKQISGNGTAPADVEVPFTPNAKKVFDRSLREALALGHNYIGTEHLLLGLLRAEGGVGALILKDMEVREAVMRKLVGTGLPEPESNTDLWTQYLICKDRGHSPSGYKTAGAIPKDRCRHCKTLFWTETVVREMNAPVDPAGHRQ